jgi:hypothetical protein
MSKRHNGDVAQPYIYHNPSHAYNDILDATKYCNVNKTIPYTIDLATTQKTYILNNVFLNNIFLSPLPPSLLIHTTLQYNCMQKYSSKIL